MSTSNVIAIVSAVIAACGLSLAIVQHAQRRQQKASEAERLAQQRERLRTAVAGAISGAETADLIVQRGKKDDCTIPELQNVARALRQTLSLLANQLSDEDKQVVAWRDALLRSHRTYRKRTRGL